MTCTFTTLWNNGKAKVFSRPMHSGPIDKGKDFKHVQSLKQSVFHHNFFSSQNQKLIGLSQIPSNKRPSSCGTEWAITLSIHPPLSSRNLFGSFWFFQLLHLHWLGSGNKQATNKQVFSFFLELLLVDNWLNRQNATNYSTPLLWWKCWKCWMLVFWGWGNLQFHLHLVAEQFSSAGHIWKQQAP